METFNTEFITSSVDDFETKFDTLPTIDFESDFESVVTSPVRKEEQEKTITITENGTQEVVPDKDKVLNKVTVITDLVGVNAEEYKGSYEVTPKLEEQIIPTASKVMRNDMKIKEIPITTVSNASGGNTAIIGG